jgi:hypothetical protein
LSTATAYNKTSGLGDAGGAASGGGGAIDGDFESAPHPMKAVHAIITNMGENKLDLIVE